VDFASNRIDMCAIRIVVINYVCDVDEETRNVGLEDHEFDDCLAAVGNQPVVDDYRPQNGFPGVLFEETAFTIKEGFGHLRMLGF
jgi:hypothetical protein